MTHATSNRLKLNQPTPETEFFIDNLLARIHFIIVMIWWTGLAPREFEFPFPGSLMSTFLGAHATCHVNCETSNVKRFHRRPPHTERCFPVSSRAAQQEHTLNHQPSHPQPSTLTPSTIESYILTLKPEPEP